MENFDKLKLASSSLGERLKTSGAQVGRIVSSKMKEILQGPTRESKIVDEAASENMEEPNWGLNLRICTMINSEELSGTEIVKAIKKKFNGRNSVCQRLSLDLLEACASNCVKVFSEIASEKLLDDMVAMIDDPKTDHHDRQKVFQLIRAWGELEDLEYLPVFRQTYTSLMARQMPIGRQQGEMSPRQQTLGSYINQPLPSAHAGYPVHDTGLHGEDDTSLYGYSNQSIEEHREFLVVTRNSLDLLSSILDSDIEPKPLKDDLTVSLVEKCQNSQPAVQQIVESTLNDEGMLFEALNLHDELQQVISKYKEMDAAVDSRGEVPVNNGTNLLLPAGIHAETEKIDSTKVESTSITAESNMTGNPKEESTKTNDEPQVAGSLKEESARSAIQN